MTLRQTVMPAAELWAGEMIGVSVAGRAVLLANVDGAIHAYLDRCAHLGYPLSAGRLEGPVVTCVAHGWQFNVLTGQGVNPAKVALAKVPAAVEDGQIVVDVEWASPTPAEAPCLKS